MVAMGHRVEEAMLLDGSKKASWKRCLVSCTLEKGKALFKWSTKNGARGRHSSFRAPGQLTPVCDPVPPSR